MSPELEKKLVDSSSLSCFGRWCASGKNAFPEASVTGCGSGMDTGPGEGGVFVLLRNVWRSVGLEQ